MLKRIYNSLSFKNKNCYSKKSLSAQEATEREIIIGDKPFILSPNDDYLKNIGYSFEPDMCKLFIRLLKKHFTVLDIGANIGCTSLLFAQHVDQVHAFEPSPTTFKSLTKNIQRSGLNNIHLNNFGLGSSSESFSLTFSPTNPSGAFVSNLTQASEGHTVESIQIKKGDDYCIDQKIHFIKIDVEGFERKVIEGLKNTIDRDRPIVVLELNHWCLNAFQRTSIPDFFDYLLSVFPILYAVDGENFADLRNPDKRYYVMYEHIVKFRYQNLVGVFPENQVNLNS